MITKGILTIMNTLEPSRVSIVNSVGITITETKSKDLDFTFSLNAKKRKINHAGP
jgi:hypothetical protein